MNPIQEYELEWTVSTHLEGQAYPIRRMGVSGLRGVGHHHRSVCLAHETIACDHLA